MAESNRLLVAWPAMPCLADGGRRLKVGSARDDLPLSSLWPIRRPSTSRARLTARHPRRPARSGRPLDQGEEPSVASDDARPGCRLVKVKSVPFGALPLCARSS